ncbi:major facilitator superfamily protein [Wolffia australiana]
MAGGTFINAVSPDFGGAKMTAQVIITCIMAASGGLIFGYDIGVSGGVTTMEPFLEKFFPKVLRRMAAARPDRYCVYDSQALTSFTSSLYIAGLAASLVAGRITIAVGRRALMLSGGALFLAGAAINAGAVDLEMLIIGRILLGLGVGMANQATPIYLSETAPARWRGALTTGFQICLSVGVFAANLINYFTARAHRLWGWRLALGLAAGPAAVFLGGAAAISDSPTSLAARGRVEPARAALRRIRGPAADVDAELDDILSRVDDSNQRTSFGRLLERRYRPQLVMAVAIPFFQQMTGINVIAFYAPMLFQAVGFKGTSALLGSLILTAINLVSAFLSTFVVDRHGRRVLFIQGGIQMFLCQIGVACLLGATVGRDGGAELPRGGAVAVLLLMCVYAAGFGWSWGPLSWVVPGEIFPVEIRSTGQALAVAVNLAVSFAQAQAFLAMMCWMKYLVFVFYATWIAVMTLFVALLLPETKGVPLESMEALWRGHWFWKRFSVALGSTTEKVSGP